MHQRKNVQHLNRKRNCAFLGNATSCTGDIVYTDGHLYTQIATSYPMIRVRARYDVAVCVYKCPLMYTMSPVHNVPVHDVVHSR